MDSALYEELKSLLEGLTHSGSALPGEPDVKRLKILCKLASAEDEGLFLRHSCLMHAETYPSPLTHV